MNKILILLSFLLINFLYSNSIVNKTTFDKLGYMYSIGSLNKDFDKYAHSHTLYVTEIPRIDNAGFNFILKNHSSNYTYDVYGFGVNYKIFKKWLFLISYINGKANNTNVDGLDVGLVLMKNNYGFSLGHDSILQQFNIGITIFKGFR